MRYVWVLAGDDRHAAFVSEINQTEPINRPLGRSERPRKSDTHVSLTKIWAICPAESIAKLCLICIILYNSTNTILHHVTQKTYKQTSQQQHLQALFTKFYPQSLLVEKTLSTTTKLPITTDYLYDHATVLRLYSYDQNDRTTERQNDRTTGREATGRHHRDRSR